MQINKAQKTNQLRTALLSLALPLHLLFLGVCLLQTMVALHWGLYIGMMDEGICLTQGPVFSVPMPMSAQHSSASMVIHTNDNKRQLEVSCSKHNYKYQKKRTMRDKKPEQWQYRRRREASDWRAARLKPGLYLIKFRPGRKVRTEIIK